MIYVVSLEEHSWNIRVLQRLRLPDLASQTKGQQVLTSVRQDHRLPTSAVLLSASFNRNNRTQSVTTTCLLSVGFHV